MRMGSVQKCEKEVATPSPKCSPARKCGVHTLPKSVHTWFTPARKNVRGVSPHVCRVHKWRSSRSAGQQPLGLRDRRLSQLPTKTPMFRRPPFCFHSGAAHPSTCAKMRCSTLTSGSFAGRKCGGQSKKICSAAENVVAAQKVFSPKIIFVQGL